MNDLELEQLDVKTTFLRGYLEEDIYIYVSTDRLHDDGGGQSPRMQIEEKLIWPKTSAENVVPEV